jgi:hypothetical protein
VNIPELLKIKFILADSGLCSLVEINELPYIEIKSIMNLLSDKLENQNKILNRKK